jgi:4-hydroxybenzoate polyprenyltransferase
MAVFAVFMVRSQRRNYRKAEARGAPVTYEIRMAAAGGRVFTWVVAGIFVIGIAVAAWQGHYAILVPMMILVLMMLIMSHDDVRHARVLDSRFHGDEHEE